MEYAMEHRMDSRFVQLQIPTQMKNGLPTLFSMCLNSNSHRRHHFFSTTGSTLRSLVRLLNWILRSAGSLGAIATKDRNGINTHERIYTHADIHIHSYTHWVWDRRQLLELELCSYYLWSYSSHNERGSGVNTRYTTFSSLQRSVGTVRCTINKCDVNDDFRSVGYAMHGSFSRG